MLSNWQIMLLNNGFWILPLLFVAAVGVFPREHWNSLIEVNDESR